MGDPKGLGMAAAVVGGYLLGRGKKGQMALTTAAVLAGRSLRPGRLMASGIRKVPGVPAGHKGVEGGKRGGGEDGHGLLGQVARDTASTVTNRGLGALADALHERTLGLDGGPAEDEHAADAEAEGADEAAEADGGEQREPSARKRPARKADAEQPKKTAARKKSPSGKRPAAKEPSPTRKTTAKKSQPSKKAAQRTRRER